MGAEKLVEIAEVEAVIRMIKGVIDCRIVCNPENDIEEIHVLAEPYRTPKQIVRDIESACIARFALHVDHKKISVARMRGQDVPLNRSSGLELYSLTTKSHQHQLEVRLLLKNIDRAYEGSASGRDTEKNRYHIFAQAAIEAVKAYLGPEIKIILEEIRACPIGIGQVILVALTLITPFREEELVGLASIRKDDGEAVVRAVLNAVERRITVQKKENTP